MQAWEYHVIYINPDDFQQKQNDVPIATRALNRMGQQGWEAFAVVDLDNSRKAILFKRPAQEKPGLHTPPDADQAIDLV